ncbi:acyl carrier protein [Lactobacillus sp. DCY120]|uniref:Acyl carrier protein n=1 Tax=Bombilactobacillus apium TaxID=2675299 RepID=A0A850R4W5_9LACO|nr:acyl carrier protein [Bombilactobacillus apium]NVY95887.1 acyl carrier protein [Bombilactobacillus apium]
MIIDEIYIKKIILKYTPNEIKIEDINNNSRVRDDLLIDSLSYISLIIDLERKFKIKLTTSPNLFNDKVDFQTIKKEIGQQINLLQNKD